MVTDIFIGTKGMNEYTAIAEYYDLLTNSGYYNYEKMAKAIAAIVSPSQKKLLKLVWEQACCWKPCYK